MSTILLTLDLGNSALKLVRWDGEAQLERVDWGEDWRTWLSKRLAPAGGSPVELVALSSVASPERLEEVRELCTPLEVVVNPRVPLRNACDEPHTVGADRLFAAAGAWGLGGEAALVLDAGTALTVDALGAEEAGGVFLGGAIAPGPELLARALGSGAAALFEVVPDPAAPALGRDSAAALRSGIVVGFQGAARELARRIAGEAGLPGNAPLYLSGGAAAFLPAGLFEGRALRHDPRLVHRGLRLALGLDPEG